MEAALPIEGQIWLAQRYAVDYEQLGTLKPSAIVFGSEHLIQRTVSSTGV